MEDPEHPGLLYLYLWVISDSEYFLREVIIGESSKKGSVLSTFIVDYNENFSYRNPLSESLDEDDFLQFSPILSRVNIPIITISDSEM